MPKKYNVKEVFSAAEMESMKEKIKDFAMDKKNYPAPGSKEDSYYKDENFRLGMHLGLDVLDTVFVGPFNAKNFLTEIGIDLNEFHDYRRRFMLLKALERNQAVFKLESKETEAGQYYFDFSKESKEEMDKMNGPGAEDQLTIWDKFCAVFGFKTEHARSVELTQAGIEAIKAKQKELNKGLIKNRCEAFMEDYYDDHENNKFVRNAAKDTHKSWRNIFFGTEKKENRVPDYVLDNGKKVSPLSLCMAIVQRKYDGDLSAVTPQEFADQMKKDENLAKVVEAAGSVIKDMAGKSAAKRFKYLDQFMGNSELSELDGKLKNILKPDGKGKAIDISTAAEYKNMTPAEKANNVSMLAQASVMFMAKEDMLKVFGKNDPLYSKKNENGTLKNPAAAEMEVHLKATMKAAALTEAIDQGDYDKILAAAGFGNDYSKIDEAFEVAETMIKEASKGIGENAKEEIQENQIDDINLEDDFSM